MSDISITVSELLSAFAARTYFPFGETHTEFVVDPSGESGYIAVETVAVVL
jgi:hypothetical protein